MARCHHHRQHQSGLTLIDMVMTCTLGVVTMGIALSAASRIVPRWRLERSAQEIAANLRATRSAAMLDGDTRVMDFDVASRRYVPAVAPVGGTQTRVVRTKTTHEDPEPSRGEGEAVPVPAPAAMQVVVDLPRGVSFALPDASSREPVVTFHAADRPDDDRAAVFDGRGRLNSSSFPAFVHLGDPENDTYRRVRVNSIGLVSIESWNGTRWE